jgi:DNA-directed RNA polymerase specialized sigma24 family protein
MQPEFFDALLDLLGDGPEEAGTAYRSLHRRLTRFFRLNSRSDPESLSDEVMNRLAKNAANDPTAIASPGAFALGIARHLLQEDFRLQIRETEMARHWNVVMAAVDTDKEPILQAMEACLARLPEHKRELLRTYYEWTGKRKIDHHRQIADRLGLTINALRHRLMRARRELDTCVHRRLRDVSFENDIPDIDQERTD